jgi:hypothetical protein
MRLRPRTGLAALARHTPLVATDLVDSAARYDSVGRITGIAPGRLIATEIGRGRPRGAGRGTGRSAQRCFPVDVARG